MARPAPVLGTLLVCVLTLLAGCGASPRVAAGDRSTAPQRHQAAGVIDVSRSDCGSSWSPKRAGHQTLKLRNVDSSTGEVQLTGVGPHQDLVYADVEPFGPGTEVDLDLPLAAGHYALACLMEDSAPVTGPDRSVTGPGAGTPGVRILTQSELVPATQAYERWVRRQLGPLVRDTGRLVRAVERGDRSTARTAWSAAHVDYQRLGATYSGFTDLGDTLDGLPSGRSAGTSDPSWTGFHRVEQDLWSTQQRGRLAADARALGRAVSQLPALVRSARLDPLTLTLRAHEIAENALQVQLTGKDDFGSHTDLESVRAELVGTQAVLDALRGPLDTRVQDASRIRSTLATALTAFTRATASRRHLAVARLPRAERERLDASLGLLAQRLAAVPATLEPRLTIASETLGEGGSS